MFLHQHPYPPFIPENTTKLIVGTIPPPRFSTGELFSEDVDFCYGSKFGLLWPILDRIFELHLKYENTNQAIVQRKKFLAQNGIGICDVIESCTRGKIDASDAGMNQIKMRNIHSVQQSSTLREKEERLTCLPTRVTLMLRAMQATNSTAAAITQKVLGLTTRLVEDLRDARRWLLNHTLRLLTSMVS